MQSNFDAQRACYLYIAKYINTIYGYCCIIYYIYFMECWYFMDANYYIKGALKTSNSISKVDLIGNSQLNIKNSPQLGK